MRTSKIRRSYLSMGSDPMEENGVKRLLWHHSDIKNIAYYFVYPLFEQLVPEGD